MLVGYGIIICNYSMGIYDILSKVNQEDHKYMGKESSSCGQNMVGLDYGQCLWVLMPIKLHARRAVYCIIAL